MNAQQAYDSWHTRHKVDPDSNAPWYRMVKTKIDVERDLNDKRILEIGCGLGGFACWLARQIGQSGQFVGADFSPIAVEKAKLFAQSIGITNIDWQVIDIQDLTNYQQKFDTIFSCETIEHVPDPQGAAIQLAKSLKKGGHLFLTTPNYFSTIGLYRIYCYLRKKKFDEGGQPICHVTTIFKTWRWLIKAGLKVKSIQSCGHYLPFPGRPPISMPLFEWGGVATKWMGHHTLFVCEKL